LSQRQVSTAHLEAKTATYYGYKPYRKLLLPEIERQQKLGFQRP